MFRDYRRIEGYEDYIISNYGEVFSLPRKRVPETKILKQSCSNGYYYVTLHKNNKGKTFSVHVLVGNAFIGKRENKLTFDHIDRNKKNNRTDNLRFATRTEQNINRKMLSTNTSGVENIMITKQGGYLYYQVQVQRNGKGSKRKFLNVKKYNLEDAIKVRDELINSFK